MKSPKQSATAFLLKKKQGAKLPKSIAQKPNAISEKDYSHLISTAPKTAVKNILVAQPQPEGVKSPYFVLEEKYKVKFTFVPFVTVEGVAGRDFRKQRISINEYSGIIFTSRNAIDHFFRICEELKVKMSQETKFFCTSEAIALYLQKYTQYRKRKVFYNDSSSNKELRHLLLKHKDSTKNLYISPEVRSKDELITFMQDNDIKYTEAVMYKTVPADLKSVHLKNYDMLVLFSPSAISSIKHNFPEFSSKNIKIAAYGKTTADAILEEKCELHLMAPLPHTPSIIVALENYLAAANKK